LALEDGTYRFSLNYDNNQSAQRNIAEEHGSHFNVSLFALSDSVEIPGLPVVHFEVILVTISTPLDLLEPSTLIFPRLIGTVGKALMREMPPLVSLDPSEMCYVIATLNTAYSKGKTRQTVPVHSLMA
jgi:hypothetical protein